jgi:hypothetical protein
MPVRQRIQEILVDDIRVFHGQARRIAKAFPIPSM